MYDTPDIPRPELTLGQFKIQYMDDGLIIAQDSYEMPVIQTYDQSLAAKLINTLRQQENVLDEEGIINFFASVKIYQKILDSD